MRKPLQFLIINPGQLTMNSIRKNAMVVSLLAAALLSTGTTVYAQQGYDTNTGDQHGVDTSGDVKYDNSCNSHREAACGLTTDSVPNPTPAFAYSALGVAGLMYGLTVIRRRRSKSAV